MKSLLTSLVPAAALALLAAAPRAAQESTLPGGPSFVMPDSGEIGRMRERCREPTGSPLAR